MTRTDPARNSAPLPPDEPIDWTSPQLIHAEIVRAQVELMHAIDKHRRAWAKMSQMKEVAKAKGNAYFMDNDRDWKLATGDVTWWRGEINIRSNSLMALLKLAELMDLNLGPKWAETTTFGEAGTGTRSFIRADARPAVVTVNNSTAREVVLGWDGHWPPHPDRQSAARAWMDANRATLADRGQMRLDDWGACVKLFWPPCICNNPPPRVEGPQVSSSGRTKNGTASRPPGWSCPRHGMVT